MRTSTRLPLAGPLLACLFLTAPLSACGEDEISDENTGPIVGAMELAVSLRHGDTAPQNAVRIEASADELRMDGHKVIDLAQGNVPDAERAGSVITKLAQAIRSGSARRVAALRLHVNTPYETTALILKTIKEANIHQVAFEVRPPGAGATTGWTVIDDFRVEPASNDPVEFERPVQRSWAEWVEGWEEAYQGCRRDHYVDCSPKPSDPAVGGMVELRFFSRGSALKIQFERFGIVDEEPTGEPQMLEGIAPPPPAEGEFEELPPVTHGAFTWRFRAAVDELSPISGAMRPLCGARECGVVITADVETMTLRLVSMLGAAFPNGTSAPHVVFHVPEQH